MVKLYNQTKHFVDKVDQNMGNRFKNIKNFKFELYSTD